MAALRPNLGHSGSTQSILEAAVRSVDREMTGLGTFLPFAAHAVNGSSWLKRLLTRCSRIDLECVGSGYGSPKVEGQ